MPYISKEDRKFIDEQLDYHAAYPEMAHYEDGEPRFTIPELYDILRNVPSGKVKGATHYLIGRIALGAMKPESGWGYSSLSEVIGMLRDAADEIQRRLLGPYENSAILKNGDVQEYME